MELHPILDKETSPNTKLWYVMSALGDCPSVRVGHTSTFIPGPEGTGGKVYVIGGANPSGPFAEVYVLDLATFSWDTIDASGFKARYEHSAFVPQGEPSKIYVFGGADQSGNHNDIQVLDTENKSWDVISPSGSPPSPRTYHTTVCVGDRFIVYSGGHQGSDPVGDRQVYCFNTTSCSWSTLNVRGDPPKPRHGHIVQAIGNKVYIHGGMSGPAFYDDLHILDLDSSTWRSVKQKKGHPSARAAHGSCVHGTSLYIFGGMNREGALDDTWKLDATTNKWSRLELEGPAPACRLDFAMCSINFHVPSMSPDRTGDMNTARSQAKEVLEQEMRMGSAGSVRSVGSGGSAGSQRSMTSAGSLPRDDKVPSDPSSPVQGSPHAVRASSAHSLPDGSKSEDRTRDAMHQTQNTKVIPMCIVIGGMDTEGEMFDDTLVMVLDEI